MSLKGNARTIPDFKCEEGEGVMKRIMAVSIGLVVAAALVGCKSLIPGPVEDGCRMSLKTVGGFKLGSLTIPLGKLAPGQTVTLNGVQYGPSEAYELTEAAQNLEQVRLMSCGILASPAIKYASQGAVDKAIGAASSTLNAIAVFSRDLNNAKTVQAGVKAAQDAKAEAGKVPEQIPPELKVPTTSAIDPVPLRDDIAAVRTESSTRSSRLSGQIEVLQQQIAQLMQAPAVRRIEITGFGISSDGIPARARESLASEFRAAVAKIDARRAPVVTFIGYADQTGSYSKNMQLALKRASAVSEFLSRQQLDREYESRVTAGGVLSGGPEARRVEIIIS